MEKENQLNANLNITKFPNNQEKYYELDKSQDWVQKLLMELNENADEKSPEEYLDETEISVELTIKKKFDPREGEKLLVTGHVSAKYVTKCIRTLEQMDDSVDVDIKACFLDAVNEDNDMYVDQTETFQENDMYELYFFENKMVKLSEMIHEQVFLEYNQYPVKNPDTELVWAKPSSEQKQ